MPARLLVILLLALLPGLSQAREVPPRTTPLEVAASLAACLQRGSTTEHGAAGRVHQAELLADGVPYATLSRRDPIHVTDKWDPHDPVSPPLVLAYHWPPPARGEPNYALAYDTHICFLAVYPPR